MINFRKIAPSVRASAFMIGLLAGSSCVSLPDSNPAWDSVFADKQGCFLLYDLNAKRYVDVYNPDYCKLAMPPLSTFKIPLAVMAFDSDILKNESSTFKWSGEKEAIPEWNQDQNATTWMANSVIWFSQKITKTLGRPKIESYLKSFEYGNEDFSGRLENAWLTPAPFVKGPVKSSLMISPLEQISFLEKFWTRQLPVKRFAIEEAQKILYLEETLKRYRWSGKTGSGFLDRSFKRRIGWFVAHVEGHNKRYLAVVNFQDNVDQELPGFGGSEAKAMATKIMSSKGLY